MKKYKPKMVKFVFCQKNYSGNEWATATPADYRFGNRRTDDVHQCRWNQNHIAVLFSDELKDDPRRWDKKAKFTENEASILLLKYLEDNLKKAQKEKRRLDHLEKSEKKYPKLPDHLNLLSTGIQYARKVNDRSLVHNKEAVKIWRKKVKEILNSKEYLWEQLLK